MRLSTLFTAKRSIRLIAISIVLFTLLMVGIQLALPLAFGEYSCLRSDNTYYDLVTGRIVRFWSIRDNDPRPEATFRPLQQWRRYGDRYAYIDYLQNTWYFAPGVQQLVIYDAGADQHLTFDLPAAAGDPRLVWSSDDVPIQTPSIDWSPDGQHVVFQYYDGTRASWIFDLYRIDGAAFTDVLRIPQLEVDQPASRVIWSAESRLLVFQQAGNWYTYDVYSARYHVLDGTPNDPAFNISNQPGRLLLPYFQDGHINVDLMSLDGSNRRTLIDHADDVSDPFWSPNGDWGALIWATGSGGDRVLRLTWFKADGSVEQTLEDNFWALQDLRWLADAQALAYVARRKDGFSVEVVNLESGTVQTIGDGFEAITALEEHPDSGVLTFWSQGERWDIQMNSYTLDGREIAVHTFSQLDTEDSYWYHALNAMRDEFFAPHFVLSHVRNSRVFRSPDGQQIAVKHAEFDSQTLGRLENMLLISADGRSSRLLSTQLTGLGNPLWSPDSDMIAFTQQTNYGQPSTLEVFKTDGTLVQSFTPAYYASAFNWTCV